MFSIPLTIALFVVFVIIALSALAKDENYNMNYYICDKCHHITTHNLSVNHIDCQYCGVPKRKLQKH